GGRVAMSSSEGQGPCIVHVVSQAGPLKIQLLDHQLRHVAPGYGELLTRVSAGLYMLQFSAGPVLKQEDIKVLPDKHFSKLYLKLPFPSAAPVEGSSASHEYHAGPAMSLSRHRPQKRYGVGGCLMIFARSIDGEGRAPVRLDRLSLWEAGVRPRGHLGSDA